MLRLPQLNFISIFSYWVNELRNGKKIFFVQKSREILNSLTMLKSQLMHEDATDIYLKKIYSTA